MPNHNEIRHKLSDYLDNTLSGQEMAEVEEHLKTCADCSDAVRELRKAIEHVRTIEEIEPPPWMPQKIMATVRAEAEKKSVFSRFFRPLAVKLPIQAVALLFLAVTAFYIYRNIQPQTLPPSEAPMEVASAKKEASAVRAPAGPAIAPKSKAESKEAPQAPGYKSLDMKYSYEKPAPPKAIGRAAESAPAPEPADRSPRPEEKSAAMQRSAEPRAAAPLARQKQAAPASAGAVRPGMRKYEAKTEMADKGVKPAGPSVTLAVSDPDSAARRIGDIAREVHGTVVKTAARAKARTISLRLPSDEVPQFMKKLQDIGTVQQKSIPTSFRDKDILVNIVIQPSPAAE